MIGDFNYRVGNLADVIDDIGIDRFIDMPVNNANIRTIPQRISCNSVINSIGRKLTRLSKTSPKPFWKKINNMKGKNKSMVNNNSEPSLDEFVEPFKNQL